VIYLAWDLSVMCVCLWSSAALFCNSAFFFQPLPFSILCMAPWSPLFLSPTWPLILGHCSPSSPTARPQIQQHPSTSSCSPDPHPSRGKGQSPAVTRSGTLDMPQATQVTCGAGRCRPLQEGGWGCRVCEAQGEAEAVLGFDSSGTLSMST